MNIGDPTTYLIVGVTLVVSAGLWGRLFSKKRRVEYSEPLVRSPPLASTVPPQVKHCLTFRVPRSIRSDESEEVTVEYFQGITYFAFEGVNKWLYERLEILPKGLPNNIRGFFSSQTRTSDTPYATTTEMKAKASSSKLTVDPTEWQNRPVGTQSPFRWRWSISCDTLGTYHLIFEFNDGVQSGFPEKEMLENPMFAIEVRSPHGLTRREIRVIKYALMGVGAVMSSIAAFILGLPFMQEWATDLISGS